jgi:chromosome segregation ATPase
LEVLNRNKNMTILLLRQLFKQAEDTGGELECDFTGLEDQRLLQQIEKGHYDAIANATSKREAKLRSVKDEQQRIENENQKLGDQVEKLQRQLKEANRDCEASEDRNQELQREIEALGGEVGSIASRAQRDMEAKGYELAEAKVR